MVQHHHSRIFFGTRSQTGIEGTTRLRLIEALRQGNTPREREIAPPRLLHRGLLSDVYEIETLDQPFIVKLYSLDIGTAFRDDLDPRFAEILAILPVAPFRCASAACVEAVRDNTTVELPRVLAEGRLSDGCYYTLMNRVSGSNWPHPSTHRGGRRVSRELGRIAAAMHLVEPDSHGRWGPPSDWPERIEQMFQCILDHLPAKAFSPSSRSSYARRWERLCSRLRTADLGPFTVIHGDLHPLNCLFGADGSINGLVDFQLTVPAPAALEFRCLPALDASAFLEGYGIPKSSWQSSIWLGWFFEALYEGLAMVIENRFLPPHDLVATRVYIDQFRNLMGLLEVSGNRSRCE